VNAIEILGSLLGGKSGGSGGADILSEILGGQRQQAPQSPRGTGREAQASDGAMDAKSLEEMLGVGQASPRSAPTPSPRQAPPPPSSPQKQTLPPDIFGQRRQEPRVSLSVPKPASPTQHDQAVLLLRAMINAAKVDGEITEDEQQNIIQQVGDTSPETIQFLRTEFARRFELGEFVASIPLGMEQHVYVISLMAIKLDSKVEADYLRQLAQGLRLSPDTCNQIHQQQQLPLLYQS
jgi:Protein of unknown function (DUF533)